MQRVVIVGAGTFGASLAWVLAGRGDEVVLVDQFEPGDVRATSGGETRLIRCAHGADADYAAMARRARTLWRELEAEAGVELLTETGVSWFAHRDDGWEAESERVLRRARHPDRALDGRAGRGALPVVRRQRPGAGCCTSPRRACCGRPRRCRTLARAGAARGAQLVRARATPAGDGGGARRRAHARGRPDRVEQRGLAAKLFPELVHAARHAPGAVLLRRRAGLAGRARLGRLRPRDLRHRRPARPRREGRLGPGRPAAGPRRRPPARDARRPRRSPAATSPTASPRSPQAPLKGSKTCRYELSADSHFIAAPHPEHATRLARRRRLRPRLQARPGAWPSGSRPPGTAAPRSRPTSRSASDAGASFRSAGSNF